MIRILVVDDSPFVAAQGKIQPLHIFPKLFSFCHAIDNSFIYRLFYHTSDLEWTIA